MPIVQAQENENREYQLPQEGLAPARCIKVLDLGRQPTDFGPKRKIYFQWELPEDKLEDGRPLTVSAKINLAIGDKATLTKLAKAATGKEPQVGFDPLSLIGTTCNITITHSTGDDKKTYANVNGYAPLMKGQIVPAATNEYLVLDLDNFDQNAFDKVSNYYKGVIASSPEYIELKSGNKDYSKAKNGAVKQVEHEELDSIPF